MSTQAQNHGLDFLINPSFQGVNWLFVLSFENENGSTSHSEYYLLEVKIKDYNVKIDSRKFFDKPINNNIKTYENIRKITKKSRSLLRTEVDYTTVCLLD